MKIVFDKKFTEDDLGGTGVVSMFSWERFKPQIEAFVNLKHNESIKGIKVDRDGITVYFETK